MKRKNYSALLPFIFIAFIFIGCAHPAYKSMDIASYNQNTKQWKFDYNLFALNPNWQYKLVTGEAPATRTRCPLSDNPADWKSSRTCTSQDLHFNNGQIFCTDRFSGHGGHMNWFPVTDVGIANFSDHSSDDDYNFYLQNPDSSLYLWSDDPDPMNQFLGLEFDTDEFPDPVDGDYNIWWNHFHDAVTADEVIAEQNHTVNTFPGAKAMAQNKLTIVTGMAGIDIGHDEENTWTTELHPVFGMFILTDEQTSINADGSVAMNDTWSLFIRNRGDEGYCSSDPEFAGRKQLNVFVPEMPYYYAGAQSAYPADASDQVNIDDRNIHITNWNGITDDNDPRRERWTKQLVNGGVILNFNFDSDNSDGIFVGDLKMNWTIHISIGGFGNLRQVNKFVDESKFKEKFKAVYNRNVNIKRDYESKDDSLLTIRLSKLSGDERKELTQALAGKTDIPGMPKLEPIPKGKSTTIAAADAGKDSINIEQFNAQLKKMKIQTEPNNSNSFTPPAGISKNLYAQRKMSKRAFIDAYLKSKNM
jgi:hypothetical protein